jgi:hypothetical protein
MRHAMIVQSTSAHYFGVGIARSLTPRQTPPATSASIADTVNISSAAREAFAASSASSITTNVDASVEARLSAIKSKDGMSRTQEEQDYVRANDKQLAEITGKPPEKLTADELDYLQKAAGFVNTFANLSPAEKALYDKAVTSGNTEAADGISQIALIRQGGNMAGGANGTTYNPLTMEITAANIEKFFSHSIVDPSGSAQSRFQALIQFMQANPVA